MVKYVPLSKKSKKEQRKFHAMQRRTWDGLNPVTRTVPNGKAYDRNKQKRTDRRNSSYYRDDNNCCFSFAVSSIIIQICPGIKQSSSWAADKIAYLNRGLSDV